VQNKHNRQRFVIQPLRGMDERHRPPQPNRARLVRDMTWVEDAWREAGAFQQILPNDDVGNPMAGAGRIHSLHWFARHTGGRQYLVYGDDDGNLRQFVGNGANPYYDLVDANHSGLTTQHTSTAPWWGTIAAPYGGRLYLINGYDQPLVFNGRFCDRVGFDNPAPAPEWDTVDRTGGSDPLTTGNGSIGLGLGIRNLSGEAARSGYRYKVTFVNERGQESPASGDGAIVTFTNPNASPREGHTQVLWLDLPLGGPNTVARRVYRTQTVYGSDDQVLSRGLGEQYYFLAEIQDNETTHYMDWKPDVSLGSVLDEDALGAFPMNGRIMATFKNTAFIASGTTTARLHFSAPRRPEVYPLDNHFDLNDDIAGDFTALYPTKNALVVFKRRGIYLIKGDPSNGFFAQTLSRGVGCANPKTISEIPGQGVAFLAPDGSIHLLAGALENTGTPTKTVKLSTPIPRQRGRLNLSALDNARSGMHCRFNEYILSVPTHGGIENELQLVYHYEIGEWSIREGIPASAMAQTGGHRGYLIFGSSDTATHPGLYITNHGYTDKHGTALSTWYETVDWSLGSQFTHVELLSVHAETLGYGNGELRLNFVANRQMAAYYDADTHEDGLAHLAHPMQHVYEDEDEGADDDLLLPHYGTAVWGTGTWAEHRPVVVPFDISNFDAPPVREVRLQLWPGSRRIELSALEISVDGMGKAARAVPLSKNYGPGTR